MDRVTAIRKSLTTFVLGIFGALPVLGVIPAVLALGYYFAVQSSYRKEWNPASVYLRLGGALALWGLLSTVLLIAVLALEIGEILQPG